MKGRGAPARVSSGQPGAHEKRVHAAGHEFAADLVVHREALVLRGRAPTIMSSGATSRTTQIVIAAVGAAGLIAVTALIIRSVLLYSNSFCISLYSIMFTLSSHNNFYSYNLLLYFHNKKSAHGKKDSIVYVRPQ